jgi:hypothetical protein
MVNVVLSRGLECEEGVENSPENPTVFNRGEYSLNWFKCL